MINKEWLVDLGFKLNVGVYEIWCAKRTFVAVEFTDDFCLVSLEVNFASVHLPHIKSKKELETLCFAISGNQLASKQKEVL